jgi:hypothetical protein
LIHHEPGRLDQRPDRDKAVLTGGRLGTVDPIAKNFHDHASRGKAQPMREMGGQSGGDPNLSADQCRLSNKPFIEVQG